MLQRRSASIFRHLMGLVSLILAWHLLNVSDQFLKTIDYSAFAGLLLISICLLFAPYFAAAKSQITPGKAAFLSILLLLLLPWGEWFQLNTHSAREHWSRIFLVQTAFLYGAVFVLDSFPVVTDALHRLFSRIILFLSADYVLFAFPVLFFFLCAYLSTAIYHHTPVITDSAAYLFQAKIFSKLHIDATAPPLPDFFTYPGDQVVLLSGRWFGMNFPGFSILLTPAIWLHSEWLLLPFLGALTLTIWILYAKRWYGSKIAALLAILFVSSPFLLILYSNLLVNGAEVAVASCVIYFCRREIEDHRLLRSVTVFVLLVLGILIRPFSFSIFVLPIVGYTAWSLWKQKTIRFSIVMACAFVMGVLLLLLYNWRLTGNPFVVPYTLEYPDQRIGFGKAAAGQLHTPARALENLSDSLLGLDFWVSGFYCGSLIFLVLYVLRTDKFEIWDHIFLLSAIGIAGFYFLYFFQDLIFGPRFYAFLAPILMLIAARTAFSTNGKSSIISGLLFLSIIAALPARIPHLINRYDPANTITGNLNDSLKKMDPKKKVLLFTDQRMRQEFVAWNDPFLRDPVIFCRDLESRNNEMLSAFPDYQPLFYRRKEDFDNTTNQFVVAPNPSSRIPGAFSFFRLVQSILAARNYPARDCVDIVYSELLYMDPGKLQLQYLETKLADATERQNYQQSFREGLLHLGRVFLLPEIISEESPDGSLENLDTQRMRDELQRARVSFSKSGDIGKLIVEQIKKIEIRMDSNDDQNISDAELRRFFSTKIRVFTSW
jgi:hypothetical protein